MRLGIGISIVDTLTLKQGVPVYEPEAQAYFARMTTQPDATRKGLIDNFFKAGKTGGWLSLLDACWLIAAHDAQAARLNLVADDSLTAVGSPVFTADRGYKMDGATTHLDTNVSLTTAGRKYGLNAGSLGVYSRSDSNTGIDIGTRETGTTLQSVLSSRNGGSRLARLNIDGTGTLTVAGADSLGHYTVLRNNAADQRLYVGGAEVIANSQPPAASIYGNKVYIGAVNQGGGVSSRTFREYAAAHIGALTSAHAASLHAALVAYLTAIGAAV